MVNNHWRVLLWLKEKRRKSLKIYTTNMVEITPNMSYVVMYPAGMCTSTITDMQAFAQSILSEDTVLFKKKDTYKKPSRNIR